MTMEEDATICPYCQLTVSYKWHNGFITEPHNVLIADWVYHSKCWNKQIEEHPP